MTPNLDHLETLAKAATPGPWESSKTAKRDYAVSWRGGRDQTSPCGYSSWDQFATVYGSEDGLSEVQAEGKANAKYIAAANPATVLALIRELRAARAAIEAAYREGWDNVGLTGHETADESWAASNAKRKAEASDE